jgi:hypothetical protein
VAWVSYQRCRQEPAFIAAYNANTSEPAGEGVDEDLPEFDDQLDEDEEAAFAAQSPAEIEEIDAAILALAGPRWRKVAFIAGNLLLEFEDDTGAPIPIGVVVRRVIALVGLAKLESQGDLRRMRFSEVRLPRAPVKS